MKVNIIGIAAIALMFGVPAEGKPLVADSGFAAQALKQCKTDLRYLNQVIGWQVKWPRQWQSVIAEGPAAASEAITTWSQGPAAFSTAIATLRLGMAAEETAPRAVVTRVHQQIRDLLADLKTPNSKYIFNNVNDLQISHSNASQWNSLINKKIVPALSELEIFLHQDYLPVAGKVPGLSQLKGGAECFSDTVTWWTTLEPSSDEIEAIGRRYLKESREKLLATGKPGDTVDSILKELRHKMAEEHTTAKELISVSEKALVRAQDKILTAFSKPAKSQIVVSEMPVYMQNSAPAGYYGKAQGNTPARYIINPSRPNERRLMAEVIAFHEGLPGHHLWVEYPRKEPSTGYNAGILEGWALYSEFLADEMELFSSTYDRQGMITKHLWAASRLIVEPGLHLRGWSRERAIQFMLDNTLLSRTEIEIEVDRYIAMPSQSLSYILGANLLLSERQRARKLLGDAFDITAFHDVILEAGVRPLPQVQKDIRAWVGELYKDS